MIIAYGFFPYAIIFVIVLMVRPDMWIYIFTYPTLQFWFSVFYIYIFIFLNIFAISSDTMYTATMHAPVGRFR